MVLRSRKVDTLYVVWTEMTHAHGIYKSEQNAIAEYNRILLELGYQDDNEDNIR
jgi:hypothetical protein